MLPNQGDWLYQRWWWLSKKHILSDERRTTEKSRKKIDFEIITNPKAMIPLVRLYTEFEWRGNEKRNKIPSFSSFHPFSLSILFTVHKFVAKSHSICLMLWTLDFGLWTTFYSVYLILTVSLPHWFTIIIQPVHKTVQTQTHEKKKS